MSTLGSESNEFVAQFVATTVARSETRSAGGIDGR